MKIKQIFENVYTGLNTTSKTGNKNYCEEIRIMNKDSIQYTNILEDKLLPKKVNFEIDKKYIAHPRDIIISVKKPYKVASISQEKYCKDLVITNNFIILRGINMDLYSYVFITNYLEKKGIKKYLESNEKIGDLTVADIKEIEIPDIEKDIQTKITPLIKRLNERSCIYSTILENDYQIINYLIESITGE